MTREKVHMQSGIMNIILKIIEGGVEITDLVHYQLPFGFFGNLSHGLIVKPKLKEIFKFRYEKISEIFGSWPGDTINLQID